MDFKYGIDTLTLDRVIALSKGNMKAILVDETKKKVVSYRDNAPSFKNKLPEIPLES